MVEWSWKLYPTEFKRTRLLEEEGVVQWWE